MAMVGFLVVSAFFLLIPVFAALGWVADTRDSKGFFASPHDSTVRYD
jgi:hypothetical protein